MLLTILYLTINSFDKEHYDAVVQVDDTHERATSNTDIALSLRTATWRRHHSNDLNAISDSDSGSSTDEDSEEAFCFDNDTIGYTPIDDNMTYSVNNLLAEELLGEDFEREVANIGVCRIIFATEDPS